MIFFKCRRLRCQRLFVSRIPSEAIRESHHEIDSQNLETVRPC